MKVVIQRVQHASVTVDDQVISRIGKGYLILTGIGRDDDEAVCDRLAKKIVNLRIFEDENGKTNLNIMRVGGEILVVSQFTLYADCSHGNRPGFTNAALPDEAERLYQYFAAKLRETVPKVETGQFGADMKVELLNDGPFTIILE